MLSIVTVVSNDLIWFRFSLYRTLMELLNQMDGFDTLGKVKMIMATNRWVFWIWSGFVSLLQYTCWSSETACVVIHYPAFVSMYVINVYSDPTHWILLCFGPDGWTERSKFRFPMSSRGWKFSKSTPIPSRSTAISTGKQVGVVLLFIICYVLFMSVFYP